MEIDMYPNKQQWLLVGSSSNIKASKWSQVTMINRAVKFQKMTCMSLPHKSYCRGGGVCASRPPIHIVGGGGEGDMARFRRCIIQNIEC